MKMKVLHIEENHPSLIEGLNLLGFQNDLALLFSILVIANLIPVFAAGVRRVHDSNKSGWWILISFVPIIGLYIIVLLITDGSKGKNRFGPKPKK